MKTNLPRTMGVIRLLVCLVWSAISIAALSYGDRLIQNSQDFVGSNIALAQENLEIVADLLDKTQLVLQSVEETMDTVWDAIVDVTFTLTDTRPLLDEASQVITQDVPDALDGLQESMPTLIETAAAVDDTLTFLSAFQFTIPNFFGEDWEIGLGVDYTPEVPLDQALVDLSSNLEDMPGELRGMQNDLDNASANLLTLRDDLAVMADDLYQINQQVADLKPQINVLAANVLDFQISFQKMGENFETVLPMIRLVYMAFFSLILVGQVPSAFVGITLLRDGSSQSLVKESSDE